MASLYSEGSWRLQQLGGGNGSAGGGFLYIFWDFWDIETFGRFFLPHLPVFKIRASNLNSQIPVYLSHSPTLA